MITPLKGSDVVRAGLGDDVIKATIGDGGYVYDGGNGSDTVDYSVLTKSVDVKLGSDLGRADGRQSDKDILISVENVIGSQPRTRSRGTSLQASSKAAPAMIA